jgi:tRNA(Ile)-lysidine synthase
MLEKFLRFLNEENLIRKMHPVLLAVSGGIDSVVMCDLFSRAGITFAIAHCNFQLRGEESDGDEEFVRLLAVQYNVPFHVKHFDTRAAAAEEGVSVQMAARRLRYEWFGEVQEDNSYASVATAHHRNDEIESFFINLVRGTGIAGLKGIRARNGDIIRPLLFAYRNDIEAYASENNLEWREDSSNLSAKYLRNRIRQTIIPALKDINPNIESIIAADIRRINEVFRLLEGHIEEKKKQLITHQSNDVLISIPLLKQLQPIHTYLFEFLKGYGFHESSINDIVTALDAEPGKQFYSDTHRVLKDREYLVVTPIEETRLDAALIAEGQEHLDELVKMQFQLVKRTDIESLKGPSSIAYLDKSRLQFPLVLRKWLPGDFFYPLGMRARKKLSDFFIDNKFSIAEKERTWVLVSGTDIVWVAGHRVDERYKVTDLTTDVFICKLID